MFWGNKHAVALHKPAAEVDREALSMKEFGQLSRFAEPQPAVSASWGIFVVVPILGLTFVVCGADMVLSKESSTKGEPLACDGAPRVALLPYSLSSQGRRTFFPQSGSSHLPPSCLHRSPSKLQNAVPPPICCRPAKRSAPLNCHNGRELGQNIIGSERSGQTRSKAWLPAGLDQQKAYSPCFSWQ